MRSANASERHTGIDLLKCLCAFLVVYIHAPFPGETGQFLMALCRVAVPVFFAVTGYFYQAQVRKGKERAQLLKVVRLTIYANLIYFVGHIFETLILGGSLTALFSETFDGVGWLVFLAFNESVFAGHTWYLTALLYTLLIVKAVRKRNIRYLLYLSPVLVLVSILFGKYSVIVFGRQFPLVLGRNCYFIGVPFFCMGYWLSQNMERIRSKVRTKTAFFCVLLFSLTTLAEEYLLTAFGVGGVGDIYISTVFLAPAMLICFSQCGSEASPLGRFFANIGRYYSTWIYIIHVIVINVVRIAMNGIGMGRIYELLAPVIVFFTSLLAIFVIRTVYRKAGSIAGAARNRKDRVKR